MNCQDLLPSYGFIDKGTIVKEITAEELENTCRKCVKLQVTDTAVLAHILDKRGLEYEILSDTQANVYGELVVSDVALELAEQNCSVSTRIRGKSGKLLSQLSGRWQA